MTQEEEKLATFNYGNKSLQIEGLTEEMHNKHINDAMEVIKDLKNSMTQEEKIKELKDRLNNGHIVSHIDNRWLFRDKSDGNDSIYDDCEYVFLDEFIEAQFKLLHASELNRKMEEVSPFTKDELEELIVAIELADLTSNTGVSAYHKIKSLLNERKEDGE